jgi:hypothetical protein
MEFLIGFGVLGLLAVLALLFGHDSRDPYLTKERALARFGMRWERQPSRDRASEARAGEKVIIRPDMAEELDGMVPAGHDGWPPELAPLVGPGSKG